MSAAKSHGFRKTILKAQAKSRLGPQRVKFTNRNLEYRYGQ
jgi:hypothetical protein